MPLDIRTRTEASKEVDGQVIARNDFRAGRWQSSEKNECGIHVQNGKMVREGKAA
ncbi:hypothetical protein CLV80_103246 [Yoonia maritima]|uniref:Uncharacterized protein n=1 Tax=Yoonia maritima TaxID=1435347 RepID=A0A2T0W1S2_9RHOB|nr:hypothetical protein [Yoonia maritima]PRY78917.1 hypothetical protein CLV80_103246 [Yoonia maritima]